MARLRSGAVFCMLVLMVSATVGLGQTTQPAMAPATQPAGPSDILDAIPADAWGFAVVPDMLALSTSVTSVGQQLGLPVPPVLPMAKMMTGLLMGINDSGSLGIVVVNGMLYPEPVAILVPVSDATQMLQTLNPSDVGDGVQQIAIANEAAFAAIKGKFVVLAPSKELAQEVAKLGPGIKTKLSESQLEVCRSADLYVHMDVETVYGMFKPMVASMLMMTMQQPGMATTQPATHPVIEILDQMAELDMAINVDGAGLLIKMLMGAKPNTNLADQTAATPMTDKPLLVGLPATGEAVILTCGQILPPTQANITDQIKAQQQQALANIFANPQFAAVVDQAKAAELQEALTNLILDQVQQYAFSISALPGGDDGIVGAAKVLRVKDPAATMKGIREAIDLIKGMFTDPQVTEAMTHVVYKNEAETIGDVTVDHLVLDMSELSELSEEDKAMLLSLVGQDGFVARIAPVGKDYVVATFGGGAKRFEQVVKLVTADKAPLDQDPGIAKIAAKLPAKRNAELFIGTDGILELVEAIADLRQEPPPFSLDPVGAPIGINSSADGRTSRVDVMLPIEVITAIADLAMQAMSGPAGGPPTTAPVPPSPMPSPDF